MKITEVMGGHPEQMKKLGAIVYALNRIEVDLITVLTAFFADEMNPNSEKTVIFNDALFDSSIFETLQAKRLLVARVIKSVARVAEEKSQPFNGAEWLRICGSIERVQRLRNKLAHHYLNFPTSVTVGFVVRKTDAERLAERKSGKALGTTRTEELNLDEELARVEVVCNDTWKLVSQFVGEARRVLLV
jgi:hypothetical protein